MKHPRKSIVTVVAMAAVGLLVTANAGASSASEPTSVGLAENPNGQECAISISGGVALSFGVATWDSAARTYLLPNNGRQSLALSIINTRNNHTCHVDVAGTSMELGSSAQIPIHDLSIAPGDNPAAGVHAVPQVPDQNSQETAARLLDTAGDGDVVALVATLSNAHFANLPSGTYAGSITFTGAANTP